MGDQPVADRDDEDNADQGGKCTDRSKIEHPESAAFAEGLAHDLCTVARNDDVRRCPDQCRKAAQKRPESDRHQYPRCGYIGRLRRPDCHGEHQGERPDIIHECGKNRDRQGQRADLDHRVVGKLAD